MMIFHSYVSLPEGTMLIPRMVNKVAQIGFQWPYLPILAAWYSPWLPIILNPWCLIISWSMWKNVGNLWRAINMDGSKTHTNPQPKSTQFRTLNGLVFGETTGNYGFSYETWGCKLSNHFQWENAMVSCIFSHQKPRRQMQLFDLGQEKSALSVRELGNFPTVWWRFTPW